MDLPVPGNVKFQPLLKSMDAVTELRLEEDPEDALGELENIRTADSYGSRCNGTTIRPSPVLPQRTADFVAVNGSQRSGASFFTRKVASTSRAWLPVFARK